MKKDRSVHLERLLEEMQLRSPRTIATYGDLMSKVEKFFGQPIENVSTRQFKDFLHQRIIHDGISTSSVNQYISAFNILQTDVLGRDWEDIKVKRPMPTKRLPVVLSEGEVEALISATGNLKHRALLMLAYSSGLRQQEARLIEPGAIDSARMQVRVVQGKGRKDRYTILSAKTLETLRAYFKKERPLRYLFETRDRKGGYQEDRDVPHPAALLCHAPAREGHQHTSDTAVPGAHLTENHSRVPTPCKRQPMQRYLAPGLDEPLNAKMSENKPQGVELAGILGKLAGETGWLAGLCPEKIRAVEAITRCRTAALGGHLEECDSCGKQRPAYNSCRNRNCPKCQFAKKARWVDKLRSNLPPAKHFHVVFTIPACLHKTFYLNQARAYSLLFGAASKALQQCASNPKYLGAQIGAVAILHTWGQTLTYHPHLHVMVPAGGLSEDGMEWVPTPKKFFLPVKVLSKVFRGLLCKMLEEGVSTGQIILPDDTTGFEALKQRCYRKKWVVYCQKPFSNPDNLVHYLGNYTHRVALSNNRLLAHENERVCLAYKDYKAGGVPKTMWLDETELARRFLQHVLPRGFYKIRYFGFMALCNMKEKLARCLELVGGESFLPALERLTALEVWRSVTGIDPLCCPRCKVGRMRPQKHRTDKEAEHG